MNYKGVSFGTKHTFNDWNLILTNTTISFPEVKKETLDIPGADGELDFTESLTDDPKYNNRTLSFNLVMIQNRSKWTSLKSEIANYLHGQRFKIILDDDMNFYYLGRAEVNEFQSDKSLGVIVISADVEPYKYDITSSDEDWLWDPFDFESGIINETKNLVVNGELEVIIHGRRKHVTPVITCSTAMQVIFNGSSYELPAGSYEVFNIEIVEGENKLKFIGNGTVSIEYRGGSL